MRDVVGDGLVYEYAGGRGADLAAAGAESECDEVGRGVEVRVVDHDGLALAAALEPDLPKVGLAGVAQEQPAHWRRSGKREDIDVRVAAQHLSRSLAESGTDI